MFSSPGDSPNFFSLGYGVFLNYPDDAFPGLDRVGLIRPPPIEAPRVPGKSASTFAELLHILRGYPPCIRDAQHRTELLRDCRYYNLKGLEQKLIFHDISYNPEQQSHEILMRIEDLRQTGISVDESAPTSKAPAMCIRYARPYADSSPHDLILEIGDASTRVDLDTMRVEFFNNVKSRVTSLFQVIASRITCAKNLADLPSYDMSTIQISMDNDTHITLDGKEYPAESVPRSGSTLDIEDVSHQPVHKKRKTSANDESPKQEWIIVKGQWRMQVLVVSGSGDSPSMDIILHAVRLEALGGQWGRNKARGFLV